MDGVSGGYRRRTCVFGVLLTDVGGFRSSSSTRVRGRRVRNRVGIGP